MLFVPTVPKDLRTEKNLVHRKRLQELMQSIQAQRLKLTTRRQLFQTCGIGLGKAVLASMLAQEFGAKPLQAMESQTRGHHHQPRVKRVIYLFMAGAPSQLDLFDNKPKLTELEGKPLPPSVIAGQRYAFIQPNAAVLAPRFKFKKHGESGQNSQRSCRTWRLLPMIWQSSRPFTQINSITHRHSFFLIPAAPFRDVRRWVHG